MSGHLILISFFFCERTNELMFQHQFFLLTYQYTMVYDLFYLKFRGVVCGRHKLDKQIFDNWYDLNHDVCFHTLATKLVTELEIDGPYSDII